MTDAPTDDQPGRLDQARERASRALHQTADKTRGAAHRAADGLDANPLGILVGGLAVGALAGALLPRSQREKELLAPLGARIGTGARQAFAAAREAGQNELEQAGLTRSNAQEQVKTLLGHVGQALASAGTAAAQGAKDGVTASASTDA